jgi:hypothetical protein
MNLKVASLIINNLRSFRFQGFNARILRGILSPFGGESVGRSGVTSVTLDPIKESPDKKEA